MKKLLATLLAIACIASTAMMFGCDSQTETPAETTTEAVTTAPETTVPDTTKGEDETTADKPATEKPTDPSKITDINGKTPLEFLMTAINAVEGSYEMITSADVSVSMESGSTSMDMTTTTSMTIKIDGNNIYQCSESDMGMGESERAELWYVDDYIYTEEYIGMDEETFEDIYENVKIAATPEQAAEYYGLDVSSDSTGLPEQAFANMEVSLTDDGLYAFSLNLSDEDILTYSDELGLDGMIEEGYTINAFSYIFYVTKEGVMDFVDCDASIAMADMEMSMEMNMKIELENIGTTVVTAPANADEYAEYAFEDIWGSMEDWEEDWTLGEEYEW